MRRLFALLVVGLALPLAGFSQDDHSKPAQPPASMATMNIELLGELIRKIDQNASQPSPNQWQFSLSDRPLLVIFDQHADRMRIITPIVKTKVLEPELLTRLLQANFDAALDARYAIGQGLLWGAFIHPLSNLTPRLFLSGVGQVVNVAESFGTTFSSGVFVFGGGDSGQLQQDLLKKLQKLDPQT